MSCEWHGDVGESLYLFGKHFLMKGMACTCVKAVSWGESSLLRLRPPPSCLAERSPIVPLGSLWKLRAPGSDLHTLPCGMPGEQCCPLGSSTWGTLAFCPFVTACALPEGVSVCGVPTPGLFADRCMVGPSGSVGLALTYPMWQVCPALS